MHSFVVIGNSSEARIIERKKLLKKFAVNLWQTIIIEEKNASIESVREAQRMIYYRAYNNQYQAVIVPFLEKLSLPAQQALLKTLEEPPKNTIIILEAQNYEQVLPTILSRSQVIFVGDDLKIDLQEEVRIKAFWRKIFKNNSLGERLKTALTIASQIEDREELANWLNKQIIFFRNLLLKKINQESGRDNSEPRKISRILKILMMTKKYNSSNVNMKLLLDHLFINLPSLKLWF